MILFLVIHDEYTSVDVKKRQEEKKIIKNRERKSTSSRHRGLADFISHEAAWEKVPTH